MPTDEEIVLKAIDEKPEKPEKIDAKAIINESKERFREDFNRLMDKLDTPLAILMTLAFSFFTISSFMSKSYILGAAFACFALINIAKLGAKFIASISSKR